MSAPGLPEMPTGTADGYPASTGHPDVDRVVQSLAAAADLPLAEQIGPLTEAHQTLRETLDSVGDA
jgi:hypothetical protein